MVRKKGRKTLFIALAALGAVLLIVTIFAIVSALSSKPATDSSQTATKDTPAVTEEADRTEKPVVDEPENATNEPAIDPELVSTVNIEPMAIVVSYLKSAAGFDYVVLRTSGGTKYVQFSSPSLVGTKCTNDEGVFASIIEAPSTDEAATLAKTTTVEGTTYGLSLADATCTSNPDGLKEYQDAFTQPFNLLKKM